MVLPMILSTALYEERWETRKEQETKDANTVQLTRNDLFRRLTLSEAMHCNSCHGFHWPRFGELPERERVTGGSGNLVCNS